MSIKKIQLKHILILVCLLGVFLIPYFVFAQAMPGGDPSGGGFLDGQVNTRSILEEAGRESGFDAGPSENRLGSIVASVINGFLALLGIIFIILMLYGGYLWMTAGGNEDKVTTAKNIIKNAIIGLIVILAAYAITYFVISSITGTTTGGGGEGGGT